LVDLTFQSIGYYIGVAVRCSADTDGARDYYALIVSSDAAGPNYTTRLIKIVNGSATTLHSASVAWASGDTVELEVEGTTLTGMKNGSALGGSFTQTDTSLTTGKPGILGATDTDTSATGKNWVGGNLTAGDSTPPTLTSPSGTGGIGVCSGSVSTDEGNGTLYAVSTASATQPSVAQVKAGQDHTGTAALRAVSQAVSATGTQTIASGAITGGAGTRYWHFVHADAAANDSAVVSSAGFSVTAALGITLDALVDESGNPRASYVVDKAWAVRISDNTLVATWTNQTTNGSGVLTLSDAALTAVPHAVVTYTTTGLKAGAKVYTPA
jgi:hypothetical protein